MSFVYPGFLLALLAISIPIIIHLFHFRRFKKVLFTNVQFLKEVKQETASRNRLKHLLVLLSRIMAICFLVFAFAQPFIQGEDAKLKAGRKAVSIYVDNSFSMEAQQGDISILEQAKRKAKAILSAYEESDRFILLSNDFEVKHHRAVNKEYMEEMIDALKASPQPRKLSTVISKQSQLLSKAEIPQRISYLISDFQENGVDAEQITVDTVEQRYFVPIRSNFTRNTYIDSCWFYSPRQILNQSSQLIVRIHNSGEEDVENSRLTLKLNGQIKALSEVRIPAQTTLEDTLSFMINNTGWYQAEVSVSDYPINFDDDWYFAFEVAEHVPVLMINEKDPNPYLLAFFEPDPYFTLKSESSLQLNYSLLTENQLIVLNELKSIPSGLASELNNFVNKGGNLLILPQREMDLNSYNDFLTQLGCSKYGSLITRDREIASINIEQEIFKGVFEDIPANMDLPLTKNSFMIEKRSKSREEALLVYKDGHAMISRYGIGQGNVYVSAVAFQAEYSQLPLHAIFAPMIYRIAITGQGDTRIHYTIGVDEVIDLDEGLDNAELVYHLKGQLSDFIPEKRMLGNRVILNLHKQIKKAGMYSLHIQDQDPTAWFAFNYTRTESELNYLDPDQLEQLAHEKGFQVLDSKLAEIPALVGQINHGVTFWKLCVIFALVFLGIEVLLLKFIP